MLTTSPILGLMLWWRQGCVTSNLSKSTMTILTLALNLQDLRQVKIARILAPAVHCSEFR